MNQGEKRRIDQFYRKTVALPEYVGGDMESYGVYAVASMMNAQWIMIKGISDWGDGAKNDDAHEIALQNAGDFIFHLVKEGYLK